MGFLDGFVSNIAGVKWRKRMRCILCFTECIPDLVATIATLLGLAQHNDIGSTQSSILNLPHASPSSKSISALLQEHGSLALIASTVRNADTLELFISAVKRRGLVISEISSLQYNIPVCLFQHVPFREKGANIVVHCIHV